MIKELAMCQMLGFNFLKFPHKNFNSLKTYPNIVHIIFCIIFLQIPCPQKKLTRFEIHLLFLFFDIDKHLLCDLCVVDIVDDDKY